MLSAFAIWFILYAVFFHNDGPSSKGTTCIRFVQLAKKRKFIKWLAASFAGPILKYSST